MDQITIALFDEVYDRTPKLVKFPTWDTFAIWFCKVQATTRPKLTLPLWSPTVYTVPVVGRENISHITTAVFDIDTPTDLSKLQHSLSGLRWCAAPTFSYFDPNSEKHGVAIRIAIDLDRPVPVEDWSKVWSILVKKLGVIIDERCKDPGRRYFQPYAPQDDIGVAFHGDPYVWSTTDTADETAIKWSDKAEERFERALKRIKKAQAGDRNNTLNREGFSIGRIVHIIGYERARDAMLKACLGADQVLPTSEAERTIEHALKDGAKQPIFVNEDWHKGLKWASDGVNATACQANTLKALNNHPDMQGILFFNERRSIVLLNEAPPWSCPESGYPREWTEMDSVFATEWLLSLNPQITSHDSQVHNCAAAVARAAPIDPFKNYLEGLVWTGDLLLNDVMLEFCGASGELDALFFRKWLIGAVARSLDPGCKMDTMLVLCGEQGLGKSSFFENLVPDPEFYTGALPSSGDKDQLLALQGPVIVEDADLSAFSAKDIVTMKSFITERRDLFRPPYGRIAIQHPRRCVLAGTSNETAFLHDSTGGRRFWPVVVKKKIPFLLMPNVRDQLWAEAVHAYKVGEQWWLTDQEEILAKTRQESHRERDPFEELLEKRLDQKQDPAVDLGIMPDQIRDGKFTRISISQALRLVNVEIRDRASTVRISRALRALGWTYVGRSAASGIRDSWYVKTKI